MHFINGFTESQGIVGIVFHRKNAFRTETISDGLTHKH